VVYQAQSLLARFISVDRFAVPNSLTFHTTKRYIEVTNTTITNSAYVIFDSEKRTTINGPFEVEFGSTIEVK